jgi:pimeloyl-ACP methyl ester carboxylesterase
VGWALASRRADRVASLTAVSTPHPAAVVASLVRSTQALRLTYMACFQAPVVPERLLLARDGAALRRGLERAGLPSDRAAHWTRRMQEPGVLTAALGWYRAIPLGRGFGAGTVDVPTTLLHGRHDPFATPAAVRATSRFVRGRYRSLAVDTGHWVPETRPELLARVVLGTVRAARSEGGDDTRPDTLRRYGRG